MCYSRKKKTKPKQTWYYQKILLGRYGFVVMRLRDKSLAGNNLFAGGKIVLFMCV